MKTTRGKIMSRLLPGRKRPTANMNRTRNYKDPDGRGPEGDAAVANAYAEVPDTVGRNVLIVSVDTIVIIIIKSVISDLLI